MNLTISDLAFIGCLGGRLAALDSLETYPTADASAVLDAGFGWAAPWVFSTGAVRYQGGDSLEAYTDGADLDGLNAGFGFSAGYVWRLPWGHIIKDHDSMESYPDGSDLNGLNGGTGFGGAFVSR
jgi:hypothetical protein